MNIELFTAKDIRNSLIHNISVRHVDKIISPQLAYAIINNPIVEDNMVIMAAIYATEGPIGCISIIPDLLKGPDMHVFWASTLYIQPKYQGRGLGYILVSALDELYHNKLFDIGGVEATVKIFSSLGFNDTYVKLYECRRFKSFKRNSISGWLAFIIDLPKRLCRIAKSQKMIRNCSTSEIKLEYVRFVDDSLYEFICTHSANDAFLRSKEMFNWILQYPCTNESILIDKVSGDFANKQISRTYAVKVVLDSTIVGFYIFTEQNDSLYIKYIYYDDKWREYAFETIFEHLVRCNKNKLMSFEKPMITYFQQRKVFACFDSYDISFSYPAGFDYSEVKRIQGGDGDLFI